MNDHLTSLSLTTGSSNVVTGQTRMMALYYDKGMHSPRAIDWHYASDLRTIKGVNDAVVRRVPASSISSTLGSWVTRNLDVPDGLPFLLRYSLKRAGTVVSQTVSLPFVASKSAPLVEMDFPVITDSKSVLERITMQGRFAVPGISDIMRLWNESDENRQQLLMMCEEFSENGISPTDDDWPLAEHFRSCTRTAGSVSEFLSINLSTKGLDVRQSVKLRCLMPAERTSVLGVKKIVGKAAPDGNVQKAVIVKKRKRLNL